MNTSLFLQVIPFSMADIVYIIIAIIIAAMIYGLLKWLINSNPWMPQNAKDIANYILIALIVLALIAFLLSFLTGTPIFRNQPRLLNMIDFGCLK